VSNDGSATLINCRLVDETEDGSCPGSGNLMTHFDGLITGDGQLDPGEMITVDAPGLTGVELDVTSCNTATVTCNILDPNTGGCVQGDAGCKEVTDDSSATCDVPADVICRKPGFWQTHDEITLSFLPVTVCGETLTNVNQDSDQSALEAMCIAVRGESIRQLARQLTAARLNCKATPGGCPAGVEALLDGCEMTCNGAGVMSINQCIGALDEFNNGNNDDASGCHDLPIPGWSPPGRATSGKKCSDIRKDETPPSCCGLP
jgi:hypothetical protein